jgi:oligoribonuclease
MPTPDHLLFTDLETTGLDPSRDDIIEAAFLLTTTNLTVIHDMRVLVRPGTSALDRLLANDDLVRMHTVNGLLRALGVTARRAPDKFADGVRSLPHAQDPVLGMLHSRSIRPGHVHLAGSGVAAFDRPFLARHMPRLHGLLHYAAIDVGVLRRTWQMWTGADLVTANADKTHRAMDDARCHLAEAEAFRRVFTSLAAGRPIPG